jgi:hypothetical protein
MPKEKFDIAEKAHLINVLKSQLLSEISGIFKASLQSDGREELLDTIANSILLSYVLARRCGIPFEEIDEKIADKAKLGILEEHKLEKNYQDLSTLKKHIGLRKQV